jgi:Uma2 family endonuclease
MKMMLPTDLPAPIRPLKRLEYERLGKEGFFDDEKVELLFGVVVEMAPIDPAHQTSSYHVRRIIERGIGARAIVREANPFAASDISEPQPDVMVVPSGEYWTEHPTRAYLVVEVARSSIDRDQGIKARLYGYAEVDEYWIVNHIDEVIEVYRDAKKGKWRSVTTYRRGETIALLAFPDVTVAVSEVLPPT